MLALVNCSKCRKALQFPPNAKSIRCAICGAVTLIANPNSGSIPPPNRPLSGPPPPVHGRKRAVICGISYRYTKNQLEGCINDAKCIKYLLINRLKFPESSILMLTDEETDPYRIPTKHNLRMALYWLVQGCQTGDSLVFHFAGHGSQKKNYNGDEVDGYDETLCPLDFETQGMIDDDEINATIVKPLPHRAKLHAIIDACYSGTVLDLPFLCRMNRRGQYVWEDHRPRSGAWKGTSGGEAFSFSGCDDDQISDTMSHSKTVSGAMTFSFIQAIERGYGTTYGSMLNSMRSIIHNAKDDLGSGVRTSLLTMLLTGRSLSGGLRQVKIFKLMRIFERGLVVLMLQVSPAQVHKTCLLGSNDSLKLKY